MMTGILQMMNVEALIGVEKNGNAVGESRGNRDGRG